MSTYGDPRQLSLAWEAFKAWRQAGLDCNDRSTVAALSGPDREEYADLCGVRAVIDALSVDARTEEDQ